MSLADEIIAAESEFDSVSPDAWYDRLADEHDRLQADLALLLEQEPERGLHLAGVVWPYWVARGRLAEGRGWLSELLARTPAEPRTARRAKALYGAGILAFLQGDGDAARVLLDESLAGARELGDSRLETDALIGLARVAIVDRDPLTMERRAGQSADAAQAGSDERRFATALHHLAEALRRQGRNDEALPFYRDAIERHRALGDRRSVALELHNLGRVEAGIGGRASAADRFHESLAAALELRHERLVGYCLLDFASLGTERADFCARGEAPRRLRSLFAELGAALDPEYGDERGRVRRAAEQALGLEEFQGEYEAGSGLVREPDRLAVLARAAT